MIKAILIIGIVVLYIPRLKPAVLKAVFAKGIRNTTFLILEIVLVLSAFVQIGYLTLSTNTALVAIGLVIFVSGVVIATVARFQLKDNYLPAFSAEPPNSIVTNGIYRAVRHPVYFGMVLVIVGAGLLFHIALAVLSLGFIIFIVYQIKKEEAFLQSVSVTGWNNFSKQTKYKLIPLVW